MVSVLLLLALVALSSAQATVSCFSFFALVRSCLAPLFWPRQDPTTDCELPEAAAGRGAQPGQFFFGLFFFAPEPAHRRPLSQNPWPYGSAQAAAFDRLSPADQAWLGGADPTDPYILARAPNGGRPYMPTVTSYVPADTFPVASPQVVATTLPALSSSQYGSCTNYGGVTGQCIDMNDCSSRGGSSVRFRCPGPDAIRCCTLPTTSTFDNFLNSAQTYVDELAGRPVYSDTMGRQYQSEREHFSPPLLLVSHALQ